jgi:hypothetical protein
MKIGELQKGKIYIGVPRRDDGRFYTERYLFRFEGFADNNILVNGYLHIDTAAPEEGDEWDIWEQAELKNLVSWDGWYFRPAILSEIEAYLAVFDEPTALANSQYKEETKHPIFSANPRLQSILTDLWKVRNNITALLEEYGYEEEEE